MIKVWRASFRLFPDYQNIFERVDIHDNLATVTGRSTCSEKRLEGPALWAAGIKVERLANGVFTKTILKQKNSGAIEVKQTYC